MVAFLLMFGVFGPLFILPKGKQHGSFSISLFTQLYGLNSKGREVRISFPIHTASADRGFGATLVTVSDVKKCEVLCKQRRKKKAE